MAKGCSYDLRKGVVKARVSAMRGKKERDRKRKRGDLLHFGRGKGRDVARELFIDVLERSEQFRKWKNRERES